MKLEIVMEDEAGAIREICLFQEQYLRIRNVE